jgi:hypothetical protein
MFRFFGRLALILKGSERVLSAIAQLCERVSLNSDRQSNTILMREVARPNCVGELRHASKDHATLFLNCKKPRYFSKLAPQFGTWIGSGQSVFRQIATPVL